MSKNRIQVKVQKEWGGRGGMLVTAPDGATWEVHLPPNCKSLLRKKFEMLEAEMLIFMEFDEDQAVSEPSVPLMKTLCGINGGYCEGRLTRLDQDSIVLDCGENGLEQLNFADHVGLDRVFTRADVGKQVKFTLSRFDDPPLV